MYIVTNAIKNVGRNKGRNILMGIIILVTITVSTVSLCINNTANSIIDDYKSRFGSEVAIAPDLTKVFSMEDILSGKAPKIRQTTPQQYLEFANSQYLKEAVITASTGVAGDGIKAVDGDETSGLLGRAVVAIPGTSASSLLEDYVSPTMNLIGNQWEDFEKGFRKLMDGGRMPEKENECIISKELADLNNLEVGDKIRLKSSIISIEDEEQKVKTINVELTVTGIYLDATEAYPAQFKIAPLNRRNEILTTLDTLINNFGNIMRVDARYYLKNPSMLEDFEAELRTKGLDEYYVVSTDEVGYQKVVGPVEGLKKVSLTFMVIVLVFGAVILIVLSSIAIRERKYEIGVLRAMGMKRKKVVLGLWLEMLMVSALCLVIGFVAGTAAAQPVSDMLLAEQIESARIAAQQGRVAGGLALGSPLGSVQQQHVPLEQIDVSVGIDTIIQIAVIALLLASLASVAAIARITKYEPIKILTERN